MNTSTKRVRPKVEVIQLDYTDVAALGDAATGDISLFSLPAKGVVRNVFVRVDTAFDGTSISALTGAVGITGAAYTDLLGAGSLLAAADTVYGDATGERGTNLTSVNLLSIASANTIKMHFIATGANLSAMTDGTLTVYIEWYQLP